MLTTNEGISFISHHNCLSLVPFSRQSLMENFIALNPTVDLVTPCLQVIKQEPSFHRECIKSEPAEEETSEDLKQEDEFLLEIETPKKSSIDNYQAPAKREMPERKCKAFLNRSNKCSTDVTDAKDDSRYKNCLKLSPQEDEWVIQQTALSRVSNNFFSCSQCKKIHISPCTIRTHIVGRHIKFAREWIKYKIKEAHQIILSSDGSKIINQKWNCTQCSKSFSSAPAIRYHLTKHLL